MSPEKDKALCDAYPLLYADRNKPYTETCMCWGFACGDGWYEIINGMSAQLEALIVSDPECGVRASQVKEKFGFLRVYLRGQVTEEMREIVLAASSRSSTTCESCGAPGTLRADGWRSVACDDCARPSES